jgi:hypothetical protein
LHVWQERRSTETEYAEAFKPDVVTALEAEADKRAISVNLLMNRAAAEWLARQAHVEVLQSGVAEPLRVPAAPEVVEPLVQSSSLDHQKARPSRLPGPNDQLRPARAPTPRQVEPRFKKGAK